MSEDYTIRVEIKNNFEDITASGNNDSTNISDLQLNKKITNLLYENSFYDDMKYVDEKYGTFLVWLEIDDSYDWDFESYITIRNKNEDSIIDWKTDEWYNFINHINTKKHEFVNLINERIREINTFMKSQPLCNIPSGTFYFDGQDFYTKRGSDSNTYTLEFKEISELDIDFEDF